MAPQQYIGKHCIVTIAANGIDPTEEYIVLKPNPKNFIVKSLKTGTELNAPRVLLSFVRFASAEEIEGSENKLPDGVRVGGIVTAWVNGAKWKFAKGQKFVVLGINQETVKVTDLGGKSGQVWNLAYASITGVIDVTDL